MCVYIYICVCVCVYVCVCAVRGNQKGINLETSHMMAVVEKLSLDYLVDEKRRGMYSDHGGYDGGGGPRAPNMMDIRKQILGNNSSNFSSLHCV